MKNYVISLSSSLDRREHIQNEFNLKNISFEFFDAIQPHTLKKAENDFSFSLNSSKLTENEKSCFMSHFALWSKAVNENLDYITIFEDDIYLSTNAATFLNSSEWIDTEIIKIEKTTKTALIKNKRYEEYCGEKFMLGELKSSHMGAGGYILSLKAAKSLLNFVKKQVTLDHVDQIIFDLYRNTGDFKIYQINPIICIQDCILYPNNQKFQTSLQWREKKKIKKPWWKKIYREIKRLVVKVYQIPYKVKLDFK